MINLFHFIPVVKIWKYLFWTVNKIKGKAQKLHYFRSESSFMAKKHQENMKYKKGRGVYVKYWGFTFTDIKEIKNWHAHIRFLI